VRATTKISVNPAAIKTILLLNPQIEIATSNANKRVKTIKIGKAYFLNVSVQHPMTQDKAINKTDRTIIIGVLTKILLNVGLLNAMYPITTVTKSCNDKSVYTFLIKPFLALPYKEPSKSLLYSYP
jgi:hypothetical protein